MATLEDRVDEFAFEVGTDIGALQDAIGALGGAPDLDDLTDVVLTGPTTAHLLRHNGTNWVNVLGTTFFEVAGAAAAAQAAAIAASQPLDSDLTTIAGLTATTDNFMVATASAWASRTPAQARTSLGLVIGTNVQAWDADLDAVAAVASQTTYGRATLALVDDAAWTARVVAASATVQGKVELATDAETITGTDTTRGTTPANLAALFTDRIDTNTALGASNTKVPSQAAVKAYADGLLDANNGLQFKGVIDASANPNYPAASAGHQYKISVAGKIGGASGPNVEIGDTLYAITDASASGTHASVGANWVIVQTNIDGAVTGPASSTASNFPTFSGTTGKILQDSGLSFDTDTALAANSASRIASQAAVKAYADTKTVAAASETVAGKAEIATDAEMTTATDDLRIVTPVKWATRFTALVGDPNNSFLTTYTTARDA